MSISIHILLGRGFPYGTLTVNVTGSILMGLLYVCLSEYMDMPWRDGLLIGLLGAFTTFSTFSIETLHLMETSHPLLALLNILLSVTLCIAGCWIGIVIGRAL